MPGGNRFESRADLRAAGKLLREKCPRTAHGKWTPAHDRRSPLKLLEESSKGRIPDLIPIRHARMLRSPFAFYRGAALNMAADLASTPTSGLWVQVCGDCHLSNFGAFATPERRVIFDINDLDESLPAPWEWDVKRLAASFVLASRDGKHSEADARDAALASVRSYRERMAELAEMRVLEVWYASVELETLLAKVSDKQSRQRGLKRLAKARERSIVEHEFPKLVDASGAVPRIKDAPPLIFHAPEHQQQGFAQVFSDAFANYRESLPEHRRFLLDRYQVLDLALKVVGVGSVGTACGIMLLMADEKDPLFLQVKEARRSVLEAYAGKSLHANHGQRVVVGCQVMQSASDLFLGWTEGRQGRHFYLRQLRDMKLSPMVEVFKPGDMREYAQACGVTLARAHARSGAPAKISGYLGASDRFDEAVASFAVAYADQSERDHALLIEAVRAGRLEVAEEA